MEASLEIKPRNSIKEALLYIKHQTTEVFDLAKVCETQLNEQVKLSQKIIKVYPLLGVKAAKTNEVINQIFRDFFTITQHQNFRKE